MAETALLGCLKQHTPSYPSASMLLGAPGGRAVHHLLAQDTLAGLQVVSEAARACGGAGSCAACQNRREQASTARHWSGLRSSFAL